LRTRISAAKEGDNMNYQIQGLSINALTTRQTRSTIGRADRSAWNGHRQNSLIERVREDFLGAHLVHKTLQMG
jgi:hypothetical protein